MAKSWEKDRKHAMTGARAHGVLGRFCWLLGLIFAIVGVIVEATSITIGLQQMSWYLLSIAAFAAGIFLNIMWAIGLYLLAKESMK